MQKGFTIIEVMITIMIIGILATLTLFFASQYIAKGKDASVAGNLVILVPAGENYYTGNNNSYENFCESDIVVHAKSQMPENPKGSCYSEANKSGACCGVNISGDKWAACAHLFTNDEKAYCVDSRGVQKQIDLQTEMCRDGIEQCP